MLELRGLAEPGSARVLVKLETYQPGGSVKDRLGLALVHAAERGGLRPGGTIIEPTAGNTGIGLALAGVRMGYRVILVVPDSFSVEKQELMRALGGEVILTPGDQGMKAAIAKAHELAREIPNAVVPQQFQNPANPQAHYETTAPEIWQQTAGNVDAWVAGSGTGGTFSGVARFLKERRREIFCLCVEPQGSILQGGAPGPHEVEGIGASFIPGTLDTEIVDRYVMVEDPPAFRMVGRLAREEGILSGSSGGANVHAALELARELGPGRTVVSVIPDSAERYMSKGIFSRWRE